VARLRRSWRWFAVVATLVVLMATPAVAGHWPVSAPATRPSELAARIVASGPQPYEGYVQSHGTLQLPDLFQAGSLADLFGSTSKLRAWYDGPDAYRVDQLDPTGETDTYGAPGGTWTWDSARKVSQWTAGSTQLRLARPLDLLPPELGRRLVGAVTDPAELSALAPVRVAGRGVPGLRIRPVEPASVVDHADLWADPATGLVLRVQVTAKGDRRPTLTATFLELSIAPPAAQVVRFTPPAAGRVDRDNDGLDVVQLIERQMPARLPAELAGLTRRTPQAAATASYGDGFAVVDVAAVPATLIDQRLASPLIPTTHRPWGSDARTFESPLVNALAFQVGRRGYVVAGPVSLAELDRVAAAVAATRPGR